MFGQHDENNFDAPTGYHVGMSIFTAIISAGIIYYAFWGLGQEYYVFPTKTGALEIQGSAVAYTFVSLVCFAVFLLLSIVRRFKDRRRIIDFLMMISFFAWFSFAGISCTVDIV